MAELHADTRAPVQAFAGIVTVSVGHCHPRVVAAIDAQNHRLQHTTSIYLNNQIAEYAQELTARLPGDLKARPLKKASVWQQTCYICLHP